MQPAVLKNILTLALKDYQGETEAYEVGIATEEGIPLPCGASGISGETDMDKSELVILYEDNHVIVVLKPQMVACCPDESGDYNLLDCIKDYIKTTYNKPGNVFLGLVHRLDRPTGGVMVFAKTSKAAARLSEQMKNGGFEKKYFAVLCGAPSKKKAVLENYLRKTA